MAPFVAAFVASFFFLGCLAIPSVDDGLAMFQGRVQFRSHSDSALAKLVQENMDFSAAMLGDIDKALGTVKAAVERFESCTPAEKAAIMEYMFNTVVPGQMDIDKSLIEADANISGMTWDWMHECFRSLSVGVSVDCDASTMPKWTKAFLPDPDSDMDPFGAKALKGGDEEPRIKVWRLMNGTSSELLKYADQLKAGQEAWKEGVKLLADAMTTFSKNGTTADAPMADHIAKYTEVNNQVYEDLVQERTHYAEAFEKAFKSVPLTKVFEGTHPVSPSSSTTAGVLLMTSFAFPMSVIWATMGT